MKVRVFKTPTLSNPDKVVVGIPQAVQTDTSVRQFDVVQTEILPPPASLSDLLIQPKVQKNPSLSANKSVVESFLTPGFRMKITPKGDVDELVEEAEVEIITPPIGYEPLEDATPWNIYSYGHSWRLTDKFFGALPGDERLPRVPRWDLILKGRSFSVHYHEPITSVRVYYRRSSSTEWIDWENLTTESVDFQGDGKYVFRAVPYIGTYPLPDWKEWNYQWDEPTTLQWSSLQLSKESFQVRMEGIAGQNITEVEAFENGVSLGVFPLVPEPNGRVEKTIRLEGVSNAKNPYIEWHFMRRHGKHRSFVSKSYHRLERNYADEPIDVRVRKRGDIYDINIQDPQGKLYSPVSALQAFSSREWSNAIQTGQMVLYLEIIRHQEGERRRYGEFLCNITQEAEPSFLEAPPFKPEVKRVGNGFVFSFEDTAEFRDVINIDAPDPTKRVAYEFRPIFWSTGVEQCLRSQEDYLYPKEVPIVVRNKLSRYKYAYSVWHEEHPRRKYTGVIPLDVKESFVKQHLRYGRSPLCDIFEAKPRPPERTRNIRVGRHYWKVLYYLNETQDEIVEFPYLTFNITVPTSSQRTLSHVELYMKKSEGRRILLGSYHPSDMIQILDYAAYYEMLKMITRNVDFQKAFKILASGDSESPEQEVVAGQTGNTQEEKIDFAVANRLINAAIAKKVLEGEIPYQIVLHFQDGDTQIMNKNVKIGERPILPDEPAGNISFVGGNKTILPEGFQVSQKMVFTILKVISETEFPSNSVSNI